MVMSVVQFEKHFSTEQRRYSLFCDLSNLPEAGPEDDSGPVDDPGPEYIKTIERMK